MSTPDRPDDEGHIADTGTFKRFVAHEQQMDQVESPSPAKGRWIAVVAIVAIIVIAVIVWAVTT